MLGDRVEDRSIADAGGARRSAGQARRGSSLLLVALLLVACSKEREAGSCLREHDNACVDYAPAESGAGKRMCSGMTWLPGERSCPAASRLGRCTRKGAAEWLYGGAPNHYDAATARAACESSGGAFNDESR